MRVLLISLTCLLTLVLAGCSWGLTDELSHPMTYAYIKPIRHSLQANRPITTSRNGTLPGCIAQWIGPEAIETIGGHNGELVGNVRKAHGVHGLGYLFNGDGAVKIPDSPDFAAPYFSITAWVKADGTYPITQQQIILFRGDNRPGLDPWYLAIKERRKDTLVLRYTMNSAIGSQEAFIETTIPVGRFVHICSTYNAHIMRLYVNGLAVGQRTLPFDPITILDPGSIPGIGIGNSQDMVSTNFPFTGIINDVQFYGRALNSIEIKSLSQNNPRKISATPSQTLHAYWSQFPRPRVLEVIARPTNLRDQIILETLAGLVAKAENEYLTDRMIWIDYNHPAYKEWLRQMVARTGAKIVPVNDTVWSLVDEYRGKGIVQGYIRYRLDEGPREIYCYGALDESVNVATSLCASYHAIAVDNGPNCDIARMHGLDCLKDTTGMTEAECLDQYNDRFSSTTMAAIDSKVSHMRESAVASEAFVCSRPDSVYEKALSRLEPDSAVIGWPIGEEGSITLGSTRHGAFQTATNWSANVPELSTEAPTSNFPGRQQSPTVWDVPWEDDVHYTAFLMSDGDNNQWTAGDFAFGNEKSWWSCPDRGRIKMGWTNCYDGLAQICPYAEQYILNTATPNDDIVLAGGGYYYPDFYGSDRPGDNSLAIHARRIADYMHNGHLETFWFNYRDWNSPAAVDSYRTICDANPSLRGIFTSNFNNYAGGRGAMRWITTASGDEVPVVAPRFCIWNHSGSDGNGGPRKVAGFLTAMPHDGAPVTIDHFSLVIVHCWSWFRNTQDEETDQNRGESSGTARGYLPALWCAEQLPPSVHVVTPTELLTLIRLRIHPMPTLHTALTDLQTEWQAKSIHPERNTKRQAGLKAAKNAIHKAWRTWQEGDYKSCWQSGKEANTILRSL